MSYYEAILLLISLSTLVTSAIIFHKVRKIHISSYELSTAAKESRTLFSQLQSLYALERTLNLDHPLPSLRGWAGSPDFLLKVSSEILAHKPKVVMECSSGVSTIVIARCLQLNGRGHVYSLEHDLNYVNRTRDLIASFGLSNWATVLHAPLESARTATPWYAETAIPLDLPPIDLLVVDGPPATTGPMARLPALPQLINRMANNSMVIADDTRRSDESKMIESWKESFPIIEALDCNCEKGCVILKIEKSKPT